MTTAATQPPSRSPTLSPLPRMRIHVSTTHPSVASAVSTSASAVRDATQASSKCAATCWGVSIPSCCRKLAGGAGRSRAGPVTLTSYRNTAPGARWTMADIRPMNFGELLDASLTIYRRHFGLFLKLAIATLSLPVCLAVYFGARFLANFTPQAPNVSSLLALVPVGILYYLAALVLTAGTVRIISESYLGRSPALGDALALGLSKLGALVGVGLGKGLVLVLTVIAATVLTGLLAALASGSGGAALVVGVGVCGWS